MLCLKQIRIFNHHTTPEIAKIYDAVGWDSDKKAYDPTKPQKPIKWVRIHNLPDLAYFNHAQHVKGGIPTKFIANGLVY